MRTFLVDTAIAEARRFILRAKALRAEPILSLDEATLAPGRQVEYKILRWGDATFAQPGRECAAVRRASLDLTRALAAMRRGPRD